jgi:asparagine synthase (glutamine-hydrolysing)
MCGIAGFFGPGWNAADLARMTAALRHRGPDAANVWIDRPGGAGLGHNRLSILDLSAAGSQPMTNARGDIVVAFNGEIYNYLELRADLSDYPFRSRSDTEVILAAWERWGENAPERLFGMFSFLIWDLRRCRLFAARDRFGVKPLYYMERPDGLLAVASETGPLRLFDSSIEPDQTAWATYLATGRSDYSARTFWRGISSLPPGHSLTWENGRTAVRCWYSLPERIGDEFDARDDDTVASEYQALLEDSVRLRFRSDVPVGINLSGGLDSSLLLGLVHRVQGADSDVSALTFTTGDARYDELPWVRTMLRRTKHPALVCRLRAADVPALAAAIQPCQDAPYGGIPTLAYATLFAEARHSGRIVLLDGQGIDEQWAGYDYYRSPAQGSVQPVQGAADSPVRPECLEPEFRNLVEPAPSTNVFSDMLRNRQYNDLRYAKIPRALRFNDRASMFSSTELREPFLDHRLVELAFRQPDARKLRDGVTKWLVRRIAARLMPQQVAGAPKRPVQTPQREWLRGPLRAWAVEMVEKGLRTTAGGWLNAAAVRAAMDVYFDGGSDNSFYLWQWISVGMSHETRTGVAAA